MHSRFYLLANLAKLIQFYLFVYQDRFCSTLNLSSVVIRAAKHIAKKAVELDLVPGLVVYIL